MGILCLNFFQQVDLIGWTLKSLNRINIAIILQKVLEVDLEYPKELCKLHNDSPLNLDKIEIRKEILSNCQLKIANFYNIPIGTVKKL